MAVLPDNIVIQDTDIAKYLNDENGNVVYPVTKQRFVLDSEGNSLESFVSDIDSRVSNLEESQGSGVTPDWNENDSTSPSYIENRTHWEDNGTVHKLDNKYLDLDSTPTSGSNKPVTSGAVYTSLSNTQPALVSGTNIKTINNISLLGEGNISIEGGGGGDTSNCVKVDAQTFSTAQKAQARQNIGAGTSNFSGSYNDLTDTPTIPSITAMSTSEIDTIIANEDSN